MNKDLNYLISKESIVLNYEGSTVLIKEQERIEFIKKCLRDSNYDSIINTYFNINKIIIDNDYFTVDSNNILLFKDDRNTVVPYAIATKVIELYQLNLPFEYIMKFWNNLKLNPSEESKKDLYLFLEKNMHPITNDGCFIAYKKVDRLDNGKLVDNYTKKIDNLIRSIVSMPRDKVNSDRNITCSNGLHVAALEYAKNYSGNVLIEVKVNPKDVVSVPVDYNSQKMRVCEYTVLNEIIESDVKYDTLRVVDDHKEVDNLLDTFFDDFIENLDKGININGDIQPIVNNAFSAKDIELNFINNLTARELINYAYDKFNFLITTSLKNKQLIKNQVVKLIDNKYNEL